MNTMEELTDIENCLLLAMKGTEFEDRIYLADESAVEQCYARNAHHEHQYCCDNHPGCVAGIESCVFHSFEF